jgi:hypothetical protein
MDIGIGSMRSVVVFYQNNPVSNDNGGTDDVFTEAVKTRGQLRENSGRKQLENGELGFNKSFTLYIRYQGAYQFTVDTRVDIDGIAYRINNIQLINQIRHEYKLSLSAF